MDVMPSIRTSRPFSPGTQTTRLWSRVPMSRQKSCILMYCISAWGPLRPALWCMRSATHRTLSPAVRANISDMHGAQGLQSPLHPTFCPQFHIEPATLPQCCHAAFSHRFCLRGSWSELQKLSAAREEPWLALHGDDCVRLPREALSTSIHWFPMISSWIFKAYQWSESIVTT